MNQELDVMWSIATRKSIENNEPYTRYEFAKMVAAAEREKVEDLLKEYDMVNSAFANDFRARGETK